MATQYPVQAPGGQGRRRLYFLTHAPFQLRFLSYFLLLFLALVAVNVFTFQQISKIALDAANDMGVVPGHPYYDTIVDRGQAIWRMVKFSWVAFFCVLVLASLLISYRIIGPILHLRRHLDEAAEGKTTDDIRFREHDFFPELAEAANRVMARLRRGA
jgi:hypothetical protein